MQLIKYPERTEWSAILKRPSFDATSLEEKVKLILEEVKGNGDGALRKFTRQFDGVDIHDAAVSQAEINDSASRLGDGLKAAIAQAYANIYKFHQAQLQDTIFVETMPGIRCWRKSIGIGKVGLYIPGGSAPLFSTVLMLGVPASIAGCKEIILCSPPDSNGGIHPAILYAAGLVGIRTIFKVGGAQAIAAMAYGTKTVPGVYKIFGPGNQYVTCAKQMVQREGIAIDMPAGPSEICVLADESAVPAFVAADLLSQAEHGADSQVVLISDSADLIDRSWKEVDDQLKALPRRSIAEKSLEHGKMILVKEMKEAIELVNEYAPEHLIISCADDEGIASRIENAGSVFLGNYAPESVGDYASGTNHTLPTNGFAKSFSGLSVDSFLKKITYQKLTPAGLRQIADTVIGMAEGENLQGHANAVKIRMKKLPGN